MDIASILGIILGIGAVLLGQILESGGDPLSVMALVQPTAALIVLGGTAGAVMLSFPPSDLMYGMKKVPSIFLPKSNNPQLIIEEILGFATKARKEGVIVLEKEAKNASDPLMTIGLESVSDGADPSLVRDLMETQVSRLEEKDTAAAKVWEAAGGYTPTVGILGAVLGLIHVMGNLSDPASLGAGIAVAFVATVYGVGAANLVFIPMASKIKFNTKKTMVVKEMMIEGILSIQAGESPALIERKLNAFVTK